MKKGSNSYWNCGGKEKDAEQYHKNREVLSKDARNRFRDLPGKGKEYQKENKENIKRDRYHMNTEKLKQIPKRLWQFKKDKRMK